MKRFTVLSILVICALSIKVKPKGGFTPVINGIQSGIGRGYDVVLEKIRAPLMTWTYEQGNTWQNPYTNEVESYPDQVYLTNVPGNTANSEADFFNTWSSFYKQHTSSMGIDASLGFGPVSVSGGFSQTKGEIEALFKNMTRNFAQQDTLITFWQLDMWPIEEFSKPLQMMVDRLPITWSSDADKKAYKMFIDAFGTHYITSAQFGGKMNFTSSFDISLFNSYSQDWVSNQVKLSLKWAQFSIGINVNNFDNTTKVDHDFAEHSQSTMEHIGGDPTILDASGYDQWVKTLVGNPAILLDRSILVPIHTVIPDNTRSNNMLQALIQYCQ